MDTRYILGSISREAEKFGGRGTPDAAVRLSGAVNGVRGEGYWFLFGDLLIVFYRELGKRDYDGHAASADAWSFGDFREEKYLIRLELRAGDCVYDCEFTPSERASAEIILNAIREAHASTAVQFSENELLAAALAAALMQGHEACAERLFGPRLLQAGVRRAADFPLPQLIERTQAFSETQKKSLLAALIELRMSDGVWSGDEQAALAELAGEWHLPDGSFEEISGILLLKNQCPGIFR